MRVPKGLFRAPNRVQHEIHGSEYMLTWG